MTVIYTIQMAKHRIAKQRGLLLIDITVKSGDKRFAPDWDFLMAYKNSDHGPEAEATYTRLYYQKLNRLYHSDSTPFLALLDHEELVFACYCTAGKFCHRHLLTNGMIKLGSKLNRVVTYGGELY